MEIKIPLPYAQSTNTYEELMAYLKQLELAVHYAQKSVRNAQDMGIEITEDCYTKFEHPELPEDVSDNYSGELLNLELRIVLQ